MNEIFILYLEKIAEKINYLAKNDMKSMKIYKNCVISVILKILRKNGRKWQFAVKRWQKWQTWQPMAPMGGKGLNLGEGSQALLDLPPPHPL